MYSAHYEMTCTTASRPPVLDIKTCVAMKQMLPRCKKWIKSSCLDQHDSLNCWIVTHTTLVSPVRAENGCRLLSRTFGPGTCVNTPSSPPPNSASTFPLPFHFSPCSSTVEQVS
ncbi:hypothetical protein K435DRAFT_208919 [Dendrothele bispora CBS 962.96]|uniref:Uncharacterized protein n=1 Tax=Dendrothele bispora (strain CBS 962.96) TaxID=1314807 RepID=A0A4V6T5B7_DENBC|nr:hypothetical protein K435DRAFT_208919 [Dendrothele bispora CBS 962.96]